MQVVRQHEYRVHRNKARYFRKEYILNKLLRKLDSIRYKNEIKEDTQT